MKRKIGLWQLMGFAVTSFGGTLLHFLYEWTGGSAIVAPFSGVNESTWEHMKLLFWPMFIFAALQSFFFREREDFWCVKARGILSGLILIPVLFYTYNGAFGKSPDFVNVLIFFVSAGVAYFLQALLFKADVLLYKAPVIAIILLVVWGLAFVYFTFAPPVLPIFQDPVTLRYGLR